MPEYAFIDRLSKCPIMELTGFFPKNMASIVVSYGFKHKEKFNVMYLRMFETGIIDRNAKRYGRSKDPIRNFQKHYDEKYENAVMFDHVKLFVYCYFVIFNIVLIVLLFEILIHKYKPRFW